jgi:excisionase family DNA binding protein
MVETGDGDDEAYRLTAGELARMMGVDPKTVHNWVNAGHLSGHRTPGRHLRFHRPELVRFLRTFEYDIPHELVMAPARVALVGVGPDRRASGTRLSVRSFSGDHFWGLLDAVMALGNGDYEVVVIALARYPIELVCELVQTLRARSPTAGIALVAISADAGAREAFLAHGGDIAIADETELRNAIRWVMGSGGPPAKYDTWLPVAHE